MATAAVRPDRKKLHDELLKDIKSFSQDYAKRAQKAASAIYRRLGTNKRTSIAEIVRDALEKEGFKDATAEKLYETLLRAVAHGYGILPKIGAQTDAIRAALTGDAWEASGLTLSQKLYRDHQHTLSTVTQAIQTSMKRGEALQALSRKLYDGYGHASVIPQAELPKYLAELDREARRVLTGGDLRDFQKAYRKARANVNSLKEGTPLKSAYREMLGAAQSGSEKHLERAVRVALEEKSRYHAERIARTEAARAYYEGFRARNDRDDDVVAYRWELSSAHGGTQHCDCEEHAERDGYGLGAGVYPKNWCPSLPAHPHCMCHLVEVYKDEAAGYKKQDRETTEDAETRVEAREIEKPKPDVVTTTNESQTKETRLEDDKQYRKLVKRDEQLRAKVDAIKAQYSDLGLITKGNWKKYRDGYLLDAETLRKYGFADKAKTAESKAAAIPKLIKAQTAVDRSDAKLAKLVGQYIEQNDLARKCLVGNLSHEAMRELSSGLQRMYKDCPGMMKIDFAGSMQELVGKMKADGAPTEWIRDIEKNFDSAFAIYTPRYYSGYRGITISEIYGGNPTKWKNDLMTAVNDKFHPVSCDTIGSVIDHEAAHAKDEYLRLSQDPVINRLYDDWMKLSEDKRDEVLCHYPTKARQDALDKGEPADYARDRGLEEFIADGAAEYKNNPTPRPIAKAIGERIIELEKAKRGNNP